MNDLPQIDHIAAAERAGVRIRAIEPDDSESFAALMADPGVIHGTLQTPWTSTASRGENFAHPTDTDRILVAELLDTGAVVGSISVHLEPVRRLRRRHAAGLGMSVRDAYQGRKIGTALMASIIHLADDWMQIRRLELTVHADNEAALALYRKFGFEIEGTHRDYAFRNGAYVDAHTMARIRPLPV